MVCEVTMPKADPLPELTLRRRGSLNWSAEVGKESEPVKRVCFAYTFHVQEFDPSEAPHACNPSPFLELNEEQDEASGVKIQRFRFEFEETYDEASRRAEFHFETTNPDWCNHGDGVRSRLLCIRHNENKSAIDGAFFIENRSARSGFGATHTAMVRTTADGWQTYNDIECVTTQLAAFDAVHRFSCPFPDDYIDKTVLEFAFCFRIGDHEYWNNNHSHNFKSTLHR